MLVYVEIFKPAPRTTSRESGNVVRHKPDDDAQMFRFCRDLNADKSRKARLIRLTDIWRPIELVPVFGKRCPSNWSSSNAVELAEEFYANSFTDKETYQYV